MAAMGPRPLLRGTGEALWAQLLVDLRRRLAEGEFVHEFPGELAVAPFIRRQRSHRARGDLPPTPGRFGHRPARATAAGGDAPGVRAALGCDLQPVRRCRAGRSGAALRRARPSTSARTASLPRGSVSKSPPRWSTWNDCAWPPTSPWPWTGSGCPSGWPPRCWRSTSAVPRSTTSSPAAVACSSPVGRRRSARSCRHPDERVLLGIADAQNVAALAIERLGCSHGHPGRVAPHARAR